MENSEENIVVLVALGGHAFMKRGEKGTIEVQERNAALICRTLYTLVEKGYNTVVTHGNGPQVGNLLLLNESGDFSVPKMPLDVLVAQTEGSLGYFLQQAFLNELERRQAKKYVMTVVTQVLVDEHDAAFNHPSKPIGPFISKSEAEKRRDELTWQISEDPAGRGWRRLVPSPKPKEVLQSQMIRQVARSGHIVIACGGGGVPTVKRQDGSFEGVEAVIDKDLTSSLLATEIGAEILVILTEVSNICTGFNTGDEQPIRAITAEELRHLYDAGEFPPGSMGPKVQAVIDFLERGGKRAIVTNPNTLSQALKGKGGTHIIGAC